MHVPILMNSNKQFNYLKALDQAARPVATRQVGPVASSTTGSNPVRSEIPSGRWLSESMIDRPNGPYYTGPCIAR
jgi:hypothetical protein